ncbi:hypothetical protein [Streptomyces sp. NPDC047097]|uniref:hypothetical protein n=1 Tax=Streptomyces sp. NPDC047097 TaxID=3155260 RepID=UPI003406D309
MKTTKTAKPATATAVIRATANPRRTTLMHLDGTAGLERGAQPEFALELPAATANPRRTILMEAPEAFRLPQPEVAPAV